MGITKMKAIELVKDWNLWPRYEAGNLDSTNVRRMREAMEAGIALPPIIASKKDFRIVDGFHRVTAYLAQFGDDVSIDVDLREYKNDAELFLEAARLNSSHGLPMTPKDKAHAIIVGRRYKIPPAALAEALGMLPEKMKEFLASRTAKTESGETIPLSAGAMGLAGQTLNSNQEHYARTANGGMPEMYASMLLNALRASAYVLTDKAKAKLVELRAAIDEVLR
jgi:hypothetical protein